MQGVVHGFDLTVGRATNDDVADVQRAGLDHHLGDDTAIGLLFSFQAHSVSFPGWVGLVFVQFSCDQNGF